MTAREAAHAVGVSERTVRRAIAGGRLTATKTSGRFQIDLDEARRVFAHKPSGNRYAEALADALQLLRAFGHEADAISLERQHSIVFVEARPRVHVA